MSNWSKAFRTRRARLAVAASKPTGLRQAWETTVIGAPPVATPVSLTSFEVELGSFSPLFAYSRVLELASTVEFGTVSSLPLVLGINATLATTIDWGTVSDIVVTSAFDYAPDGVVVIAGGVGVLFSQASPVGFSTAAEGTTSAYGSALATSYTNTLTITPIVATASELSEVALVYEYMGTPSVPPVQYVFTHNFSPIQYIRELTLEWESLAGGGVTRYSVLNLSYELQTDVAMAVEYSSLDMAYELQVTGPQEITLDICYSVRYEEIAIDFKYAVVGSNWVHDLLALINAERTSLGLLKQIRAYDASTTDIASRHAIDMSETHVYEHDSTDFPLGWRTTADRAAKLPHMHGDVLENQLVTMGTNPAFLTPLYAYNAWYASPLHYANMFYDWPAGSDPTLQVGVAHWGDMPVISEGVPITTPSDYIVTYAVTNFIDMNDASIGGVMQIPLNLKWTQTGALIEQLVFKYEQDAYKHVALRFTAGYAIVVSSQHAAPWSVRAAAQHEAPQHYTVAGQHSASYAPMTPLHTDFVGSYDIQQYAVVTQQNASGYSIHVSTQHYAAYDEYLQLKAGFYAPYEGLQVVRGEHEAAYEPAPIVSASCTAEFSYLGIVAHSFSSDYAYRQIVKRAVISPYADEVRVVQQYQDQYDLLAGNPVVSALVSSYSLQGLSTVEMVDIRDLAIVAFSGRRVEQSGVEVATSEEEYVWSATVDIASPSDYISISIDDPFTVTLSGEVFNFIVTGKSLNRDAPENVSMTVSGHSENIRFTDPRASTISYTLTTSTLASDLVEDILGVPISWGIVDWTIPPMYFAVDNVTPIAAAQTIVEAAGGILESTPAGALVARYLFPVSVPQFATAPADYILTDSEDNLSYGESIDTTDVINKLRIRNGSDTTADSLEFTPDENTQDYGILRAYVLPWRAVDILHTGGAAVALSSLTVESRMETELVEVVDGVASLRYPAVSVQAEAWKSDTLGPLILDPRTRDIRTTDTTTNYGYGLVEVTYVVECYACSVQFPLGDVAQFILKTQ